MSRKKTKYITAVIVFVVLSICSIFLSAIIHKILIKDSSWFMLSSFGETVKIVIHDKGARTIFFGFEILIVLCLVASQLSRTTAYRSELVSVAQNIEIPKEAGEKQYGSARFYRDDELDAVFDTVTIKEYDKFISDLMQQGYDDLKFMNSKE